MSAYVVWLDHENARLFKMKPGGVEATNLVEAKSLHHTSSDVGKRKDHEKLFHELALKLNGATEILLVGPGLGKNHFRSHLEKHHHRDLASKIVGVETLDHPSDAQILAQARKFFKTFDQYR